MVRFVMGLVLASGLLSGCASQAEIAQRQAEIRGAQEGECRYYGLQRGTPAYADCMLRQAGMQQQQDIANQQQDLARRQAIGRSLSEAGAAMSRASRSRRTIDCDTTPTAGGSTTSCTEN